MAASSAVGLAPGRLDLAGGVADYSGSLVLQCPTRHCETRVEVALQSGPQDADVELSSSGAGFPPFAGRVLDVLRVQAPGDVDLSAFGESLRGAGAPPWTRYVVGCIAVWYRETRWLPPADARLVFRVASTVPAGQGVASSAALEVATLRALRTLSGAALDDLRLAHAAKAVENLVVGAPCGLMDQLACSVGMPGCILPILCRPDACEAPVPLPAGVVVVGWPSGEKHTLAGGASPYAVARAAAFMGKRVLEARREAGGARAADKPGAGMEGTGAAAAPAGASPSAAALSFLAEITPSALRSPLLADALPETLAGAAFASAFGETGDALSSVSAETVYPVRAAASFPIEEHHRCDVALSLLRAQQALEGAERAAGDAPERRRLLRLLGELLCQSHEGYGAMGLGSRTLDSMRAAACAVPGVYGARISGGGSGGTLVVLAEEAAIPALEEAARATAASLGREFRGFIA